MCTNWIKCSDRPPEKPGWYLVDNYLWDASVKACWTGNGWGGISPTHWRDLPPRAPKPDAFEEWWGGLNVWDRELNIRVVPEGTGVSKLTARAIWDAAMAVKEGK